MEDNFKTKFKRFCRFTFKLNGLWNIKSIGLKEGNFDS